MKARFFSLLTFTHRWTGMTIGLVMVFLAVTGAGQAFRGQLEPVVYGMMRAPVCAEPVPLDALAAAARADHPGAAVESLRFHPGADEAAAVRFADRQIVYVDPCSARVSGRQAVFGGLFGSLEYIHRLMFFEDFRLVGGTLALICLLLLVIGGVLLWWPRTLKAAAKSLTVDKRLKGMAFMLGLHKTAGLYACVVLAVVSLFGVTMAFDWAKQALYWAAGSEGPKAGRMEAAAPPPDGKPLTLQELWGKAAPLLSDPRDVTLRLPRKKGDPAQFVVVEASAPHPRARDELALDVFTGTALRFVPYEKSSLGNKIYNWGVAIHTGQAGGAIGSLIVFLASMMVPVLAYTGIASWLRRRRSRRKLLSRAPSSPNASEARSA